LTPRTTVNKYLPGARRGSLRRDTTVLPRVGGDTMRRGTTVLP